MPNRNDEVPIRVDSSPLQPVEFVYPYRDQPVDIAGAVKSHKQLIAKLRRGLDDNATI